MEGVPRESRDARAPLEINGIDLAGIAQPECDDVLEAVLTVRS